MGERLGLTDAEVEWLRENMNTDETAKALVRQYQMVRDCPQDPGARGVFAAMLADWRREKGGADNG